MDLSEIPRVPLIFGILVLALVAGVAGFSYFNNTGPQQIATPAPAAQEPLTDEQMKENLENPTADMNASDVDLDSESVDSGTVSDQGTTSHTTRKKAVSAVALKKPKTTHTSKPVKPQKPTNPTNTNPNNPTEPQNPDQPGQGDEGYYSDEPWDPLEPPAENPDGEGDYGGDDNPDEDNGGQGDLMP